MKWLGSIGLAWTLLCVQAAQAEEACTLVVAMDSGSIVHESGVECATRFSPASTFKLALALMGFESGLLQDAETPAEPYRDAYNSPFEIWRHTTAPKRWLKYSVVWYSQVLTRRMGMPKFQNFVDRFDYGNRDLSGEPGKDNGLTNAWLSASLKISPPEQISFLRRIVHEDLPVDAQAFEKFFATIERFESAKGSTIYGKTGTAFEHDQSGVRNGLQSGWFVGWVNVDTRAYAFVRLNIHEKPLRGFAGSQTQREILAEIDQLIAGEVPQ